MAIQRGWRGSFTIAMCGALERDLDKWEKDCLVSMRLKELRDDEDCMESVK